MHEDNSAKTFVQGNSVEHFGFVSTLKTLTVDAGPTPLVSEHCGKTLLGAVGIEQILVISTDDARFQMTKNVLVENGLEAQCIQRWFGIQGKRLLEGDFDVSKSSLIRQRPKNAYEDLLDERTKYSLNATTLELSAPHNGGAIGCYLSHISTWMHIVDNDISAGLIFEDDVEMQMSNSNVDLQSHIATLIKEAGGVDNFDMLLLQSKPIIGSPEDVKDYSLQLYRTYGPAWCAQAYIMTNRGARKLLQKSLPINVSLDLYYHYYAANHRDSFVLLRAKKSPFSHPVLNFIFKTNIGYGWRKTLANLPIKWVAILAASCLLLCLILLSVCMLLTNRVLGIRAEMAKLKGASKLIAIKKPIKPV